MGVSAGLVEFTQVFDFQRWEWRTARLTQNERGEWYYKIVDKL